MIVMRHPIRSILIVAAAGVLGVLTCAPLAAAETLAPWWSLTTGARPTNLGGSSGKDDVQSLRVSATKGDYLLVAGEQFIVVPFDVTAAVLREDLAAAGPVGAVPPTVTEEPSGEEDARLFKIVYPSETVQAPVVTAEKFFVEAFGGVPLEGGKAEVVATQLEEGAPSENEVVIYAENLGDVPTSGKITITDQLPEGITATRMSGFAGRRSHSDGPVICEVERLTCTFETNDEGQPGSLPPFEVIEVRIWVHVGPGAVRGALNNATVSGGGAAGVTSAHPQPIEVGAPQRFGFEDYSVVPEQAGGLVETQAGSHPFQLTTDLTLNSQTPDTEGRPRTVALPKDIVAELPPGVVGNVTPFAQCTDAEFAQQVNIGSGAEDEVANGCPAASAIGVATVTLNSNLTRLATFPAPIFNMVPRAGEPARFGFKTDGVVSTFLDASVRTGGDYGVTVSSLNITQGVWLLNARITIWGVPGSPAHDGQRGWNCVLQVGGASECPAANAIAPPPFLTLPTSCGGPFESHLTGDSWGAFGKPSEEAEPLSYRLPEAIDGCNHLPFSPSIKITPDGSAGSTPTGVLADVHVPQTAILNAESLAESAVRDISVTLPEGMALNPAGADGLQACSEAQIGYLPGDSTPPEALHFSSSLPEPLQPGVNFCPDASKVGTVKITTPLLANPLEGSVYLATQNANPFGSLVAMYLEARDPVSGTLVKLPGEVSLNQATGQITATFKNSPELPFEDAELHFFGGERAPLATPARCGTYTTNATFTPWSGNEPVSSHSSFNITSGPNGSACPGAALPFSPSLTAGTVNNQAGSFSAFTMTMSREDGQQNLKSIQLHMPAGLSGVLTGIPLCDEADANAGTCSTASLLGETTVSVGLGGSPYSVKGGQVFLTGPYKGAPFGLSIVNPAVAGPFNLGKVIVRAKLEVDPHTAAVTVTSDETGPYAIPPSIDGIPLQIKHINVTINRPGFTFNPTNCTPTAVTGSLQSIEGGSSSLSVPFQATNCAVLKFAPKFAVSTSGKNSKANGASLSVKLTYPNAPQGTQANIKQVKVELPKQLPSRLTTLQKACTSAQFETNPAGCPAASIIGHAKATTPLIPVPLEGPAYFVSHGGEAFPSLIMVLSGYGVRLDLVGTTFISKTGITSSTFKTVPDAPVGSFELTLPQGPYSALTALGNLCTSKLSMPTEFVAQNGAIIHQTTPVAVNGCPKKKTLTRAQKLAAALKLCHKDKNHAKRARCEKTARKTYGPIKKTKHKKK
jgi:hypothetical protein